MPASVVIVPAWRKSDFLYATLHRLALADDACEERVDYMISVDSKPDPEVMQVAWEFRDERCPGTVVVKRRSHDYHGNSYNVLMAFREATSIGDADLVHLVEDDIFVGEDYFRYHRAAHELNDECFAVSACHNQNQPGREGSDEEALRIHYSYQSLGVSFRTDKLALFTPYVSETYFEDPIEFCRTRFPLSAIPAPHAEQDGLLNRVRELHRMYTLYPDVPRAYHAGFEGYHRPGQALFAGTVEERGRALLEMDSEELNRRAAPEWQDHEAFDLDAVRKLPAKVSL